MKRIFVVFILTGLSVLGLQLLSGPDNATSSLGMLRARAASTPPACSMNQSSLADLIKGYDPPVSTASTTIPVGVGALSFTCTGLGSGMAAHVYVLVNGQSSGSYTNPFLTGPNSFQLSYNLCVPGASTCSGTSNVWNSTASNTTAYETTSGVNSPAVNTIPAFTIFVGRQDAYVGSVSQYTGSLYFSFKCGEGGNQVAC